MFVHRFLSEVSQNLRLGFAAWDSPRLHRFCPWRSSRVATAVVAPSDFRTLSTLTSVASLASSAPSFFGPSLQRRYPPSSLLRPLLTSPPLSRWRSPQVRRCLCLFAPPDSTCCVSDDLWASLLPASLPPAPGLPVRSCSCGRRFAIRFFQLLPRGYALRFRYGCRHRLRLAPFIQLVAAHAGHTGAGSQRAVSRLIATPGPRRESSRRLSP